MDGLYFRVADSNNLRYYLAKTVELECEDCPEEVEAAPCPDCPDCPEPEPCPEVTPEIITVTEQVNVTEPVTVDEEPNESPGMEAVFAIAGLLAIAYLVIRQRD